MSKSSKNSKENSSKEIDKAIKDAEGKKHKYDKLNTSKGTKSKTSSSAGASLVGRTLVSKMKKLKRNKDPVDDYGSEVNEDSMNYLRRRDFHHIIV